MEEKLKKKSLKRYISDIFKESSITAVSNIFTASCVTKKVFRTFVLLLCLAGFLYQCTTFLMVVFQYPTAVDVHIERPEQLGLPAFTFCNNNGIKRSSFCSRYPDNCVESSEKFCKKQPWYCVSNKTTLMPKKEYYGLEGNMTVENIYDMGQNATEFVTINDFGASNYKEPEGPYLRKRGSMYTPRGRLACYTLNSHVDSSEELPTIARSKWFKFPLMEFQFDVEEEEMFVPGNRAGVLFSVHSPYEAVNPFEKGFFLKPGRSYKIHVSLEREVLLPYPYETDCLKYEEIWEAKNRTGPRQQEMCNHKCLLVASMKCFNCVIDDVLYPHKERTCLDIGNCPDEIIQEFFSCVGNCKDDCSKTKYYYDAQERFTATYDSDGELKEDSGSVYVEIYLEDEEIVTMKHIPKYMTVEVFSSFGGYIGLWLGISLIQVADFFESLFRIIRHAIRKRNKGRTYVAA